VKTTMTPKRRFLAALSREMPDRLPVTTHHVMPYFLKKYLNGISNEEFFDAFALDPVKWFISYKPDESQGEYYDPGHIPDYLQARRISSDRWKIQEEIKSGSEYKTVRYSFITPGKTLTTVLESNDHTTWVSERLIKEKTDIEIIAKYATAPKCDVSEVNRQADVWGEKGMIRGFVNFFDVYGQPGCWQDAAVLFGIQKLIMETFDDPEWVHSFLKILFDRKKIFIESMKGARYDVIEHGGGDASSTVISPAIFDRFVSPYDAELVRIAHEAGQRVVYHTCGGMMPILERIADMNPDAMETFTPPSMGGDSDLGEAKRRVGGRLCMIGGFDQFHYLQGSSEREVREAVRKCFREAGEGGGYILAPSDHFFDADLNLLRVFSDEARKCVY